jgi:hypothetical protein
MHDEVNDSAARVALPANPDVLAQMDGEPVGPDAFAAVATDRARADELEPDPSQRHATAMDFIGDRHRTGAGDTL